MSTLEDDSMRSLTALQPDGTVIKCVSSAFFLLDPKRFGGKLPVTFTVQSGREQLDRYANVGFIYSEKERTKVQSDCTKSVECPN